jgi:excisionase family DNA binding protein
MNPMKLYPDSPVSPIGLRTRDAAALLSISVPTLVRLTQAGEIPVAKIGRCNCYPVAGLTEWLTARTKGGSHDAK